MIKRIEVTVTDDAGIRYTLDGDAVPEPAQAPPDTPNPATPEPARRWAPGNGLSLGIHDRRPPWDLASAFPGAKLTREFVGGIQNQPDDVNLLLQRITNVCGPSWDALMVPIVSVKLNVAQVMADRWRATLHDVGAALADRPPTIVSFWHEPEDNMTAAAFAPYFNLCRQQIKAGAPDLTVAYIAMAYQWAPKNGVASIAGHTDDVATWQSVDADVYGVDVYSGRSVLLSTILPEHPGFSRWHEHIIGDTGRPWMVTERGFEAGPALATIRADTITRELAWLAAGNAAGCCGYVYWNTPGAEGHPALVLDPVGEAQLRHLISISRTAG